MISHSLLVNILPIYLSLFGLSANLKSALFIEWLRDIVIM